jgi:c-di-GMP-binding flagellar brake protein YcgR
MNAPTGSADEIERYRIVHPGEIERILRSILDRKALVTVYSDNNRDFLVTTLIAVDTGENAIYLGGGADEKMNAPLLASRQVSFNTAHDQVRVLFTTSALTRVVRQGETMLKAPMPGELLRFQRREYFRVATSTLNPVRCLIAVEGGMLETTVADISIGGVGVLSYERDANLRPGTVYHGCRLTLPDTGNYVVSLRVRSLHEQTLRNGNVSRRAGCQFIDLPPSVETDIQRYIIRIERERRIGGL